MTRDKKIHPQAIKIDHITKLKDRYTIKSMKKIYPNKIRSRKFGQ